MIKTIISSLFLLLMPALAHGQTLGDIATSLEQKIYSTIPKDQASKMFNEASTYAISYLSSDLVQEQQMLFANSFADSYLTQFKAAMSPQLKSRLNNAQIESMRSILRKNTLDILSRGQEQQLEAIKQALPQCTRAIQADVVALFVVGQDQTFAASSTMSKTANCLLKESNLNQVFSQQLQPHKFEFGELLLREIKRDLQAS